MSNENRPLKHTSNVLKWYVAQEETDDEHNSQSEELNRRKLNGDPSTDCDSDDSTLSLLEFSSDVIPASFSNLNTTKRHTGILKTAHKQSEAEFLEEVESISSDITDSLTISNKTAETSQEIEFRNQNQELHYIPQRCRKRNINPTNDNCKRKKLDESQVTNNSQSNKRTNKNYTDIDELLRKLKYPDKLSVKDRKRTASWVRRALTEIRNETESMLRGMTPVPNKMHIQTQLMRSRKLCDHLTTLYEEFPNNSQKRLLEEVSQVREIIQSELKGILDLLNYGKVKANRFVNETKGTTYSESTSTGVCPESTVLVNQHYVTISDNQQQHEEVRDVGILESNLPSKQIEQNKLSQENASLPVISSPVVKEASPYQIIDLTNSPICEKDPINLKLTTGASGNKIIQSVIKSNNSPKFKKQVHFNLQPTIQQHVSTKHVGTSTIIHPQRSYPQKFSNINIQISQDSEISEASLVNDSVAAVLQEAPIQPNVICSEANIQNCSEILHTNTQNSSIYSDKIPEGSLNVKSPERTSIPLHQGLTKSTSLKPQNYVIIPTKSQNTSGVSTSKNPVYVIIVNGNKCQSDTSSTSMKSHSYHNSYMDESQKPQSISISPSREVSHSSNQSISLFHYNQTSQIDPNINETSIQQFSKISDTNRILKSSSHIEYSDFVPNSHMKISETTIDKIQEQIPPNSDSQKTTHFSPEKSQHLGNKHQQIHINSEPCHLDEQITEGKSNSNLNSPCITKQSSEISHNFTCASISTPQLLSINYNGNSNLAPSLTVPPSQDNFLSEFNSGQAMHSNTENSQPLSQSQCTNISPRLVNDVHSSVTSPNSTVFAQTAKSDLLQEIQISGEIHIPKLCMQNSVDEHSTTTQSQTDLQKIPQLYTIQKPHHRHSTYITPPKSLKQTSEWIQVIPPKLPWQVGETLPESQFLDLPKLPCPLPLSLDEFKNFKIPKLPWDDIK